MRIFLFAATRTAVARPCAPAARFFLACALVIALVPRTARADDHQVLLNSVPAAVADATLVRPSPRWEPLNLTIGLPLRNRAALTNLLHQIYDPGSTNYHHFLTPDQFAQKFGPTEQDYAAVVNFARTNGLTVTARHSNRSLVSVRGTVADVQNTFHVTLNEYQHPTEPRTFRAPATAPSIDLGVPVLSVNGLDNYVIPHPCLQPSAQAKPATTGSGPSGTYVGKDFRAAYVPGVPLTGTGQTVGLLEFESGFYQNDITAYENLAGLPNVPVTPVLLDGYTGGAGIGNDEVSLDIEMAISMAPGLNGVLVYEGNTTDDILNRMATDNLARQLSASWTYPIDATSDQIFLEFAAQGQTFFNASGDSDAYVGAVPPPTDDPNITIVGGTTLTTTGPAGAYVSETVWNWGGGKGSSGGISTSIPIPVWQQGIDMSANQGSTTLRNLPDVAMVADNVFVMYGDGQSGDFGGTSCATPLWAAMTALINQLALTNNEPAMGFLNPAIYDLARGSNALSYASFFHDVTNGNNESIASPARFTAVPGYDLCTGWGTPMGSNLINTLALPEALGITPSTGVVLTGPVGGPFNPITPDFTLTNNAAGTLNWSLVNTSAWFNVAPVAGSLSGGGPATTVIVSASPLDTNLPPGSYSATLWFTNLSDGFGQSHPATLDVVTPPVITSQPASQALLEGMTASFTVDVAANALMFYQWQENGTNLTDGGDISGSTTSTLTISSVTFTNMGAYSVVLTNAAGTLVSSNALLTIIPSAPVIVQQPTNQSVLLGAPATFSVAVVGNLPYFYQWQLNGTNLSASVNFFGVTNRSLTVSNTSPAVAGVYSVTISNSLGSVTSTGAVLVIIPISAPGVTVSTVLSFNGYDGAYPFCPLALGPDGKFYGTTFEGGGYGLGTVFQATTNGAVTTLYSFVYNFINGAAAAGELPYAGLDLGTDGNFYGAAYAGGFYADGNVFRVATNGNFAILGNFTWNNGGAPMAGMVQGADGNFYGTTYYGGAYTDGTVYRMTPGGTLTDVVSFDGLHGEFPSSVLARGSDGNFYGTTSAGGTNGAGLVFTLSLAGQFTILHEFNGLTDGAVPAAGLVQGTDGAFYGTTFEGGSNNVGTVYKMETSGVLTTLYQFAGGNDGAGPFGGLVQAADGNLYGTCQSGGAYGSGTVFQISPTGQFATLVQFDGYAGGSPSAALVQGTDGSLYGTTQLGGAANYGTIYRISISGPLQITGQPTDQSAFVGDIARFTVATSGGSPVYYQWQQDGVNLTNGGNVSGANSATLVITNVSVADSAIYSVAVSNAFNSLESMDALLQVIYSPPDIITQPASQTLVAGMTAMFSVVAVGDVPLTYQWQENGTNLADGGTVSGSATSILTLARVTPANDAVYSVIVSNGIFAATSAEAALTVVPPAAAGTALTSLHLFTAGNDGAFPYAGLIQGQDTNLYGTTFNGGSSYQGTIYRLSPAGALSTIHSFAYDTPGGEEPVAGLVQGTNGSFYGNTAGGGADRYGTVYVMNSHLTVTFPYSFTDGIDGGNPQTGLNQGADGNFYGTTAQGGVNSLGSIYRLTPSGVFTNVWSFAGGTNGAYPEASLVQAGNGNLYGTTANGGLDGDGTVFSLDTNGIVTTLASLDYLHGANPVAAVIPGADGRLYGTSFSGGTNGDGTVFSLTTNGVLATICSFSYTNGANPAAALVQGTDGNLYGTTSTGGAGGQGTVFRVTTNGLLTTLVWFDGLNGADPQGTLVQAANGSFYGTTPQGGTGFNPSVGGGNGTIFEFTVPIFISNPFPAPAAIACLPYNGSIAGQAVAPPGDPLTFAKVSGPAWLLVATNGLLSGTPTNTDVGTNHFVVSLTDSNGVSATAGLQITVTADPPPTFLKSPFGLPWANLGRNYAGDIATNATAPYIYAGDQITFAKVSGPAWLNVAANGSLSGTPLAGNGGTNLFVVSATDLGGAFNTASLFIYVNSPPSFTAPFFTNAPLAAGIPYNGSLAPDATDPDLAAGDTLAFYKVTGPAWLNVATNGTFSGTPATADLGVNSFLMLVTDSGGLAAVGTLDIPVTVAVAPAFIMNPFAGPPAQAGQAYALTIATNITDPNFGDALTFSKVSGPAWLSVAANGSASGLPYSINAGTNSFVVRVTDLAGLSGNAALSINVTAVPLVGNIANYNGQWLLSWTGGVAPWQVQMTTNLAAPLWQNLDGPTSATNLLLPPAASGTFYRIQGN